MSDVGTLLFLSAALLISWSMRSLRSPYRRSTLASDNTCLRINAPPGRNRPAIRAKCWLLKA